MDPSIKYYSIIPPDEEPCVWMVAGILSYQLCDRGFGCDECPLDAAMKKQFLRHRSSEPTGSETSHTTAEPGVLPDEYGYSRDHCWVKQIDRQTIRIGIEPDLARALLIPKAVVLPTAGQPVRKNQPCAWIIIDDGTFPVTALADGEVVRHNANLMREPQELYLDPLRRGWLFDLSTEPNRLPDTLDSVDARLQYHGDSVRFKELMIDALRQEHAWVGETLADGGRPLQSISQMLGPKKYYAIVREVYATKTR